MALAVTELALSTLSPVIKKLGSYVYHSKLGGDVTAAEMKNLYELVRYKIRAFIRTAESDHSDELTQLLEELQAAAFEAEDLLDLYQYEQIEKQVSSSSNPLKKLAPKFKDKLGFMLPKSSLRLSLEHLLKVVDKVEKIHPLIKSMADFTQQNHKMTPASSSNPTTSTLFSPYFGRVKQIDNIIKFLLDESLANPITRAKRVPIISIRGMGGSGKTVTAQCIYKDVGVINAFQLKMWVHVARNFDVRRLTKEIIESAKQGKCDQIDNLDVLQTKLKESVSQRKFLLVLDDVWCADVAQWDLLLGPLNEVGVNGSKIIITTRMEHIASTLRAKDFHLEELEVEDCWSILKHYAFDNYEEIIEDQELVNVGNQIISKVKSSPLALKVAGSSLREQKNFIEWEKILKQDMLKGTMDLLLFSFQHLPSHLQRCFAYCSLFPKGYKFRNFSYYHREQLLIPLWIAQGYVENYTSELTLEEKGSIYIKELISYSFFEKRSDHYFVIHDLLHDLAENVSKERCHRIENNESLNIPAKCIHLSMCRTEELRNLDVTTDASKFKNLRTLIILGYGGSEYIFKNKRDILLNLIKLRVLYVETDDERELISDHHVDKLKHLRYLHAAFDEKLPRSLAKLYHLQFCHLITRTEDGYLQANTLPQGFGNLTNLRTLNFYGTDGQKLDYLYYNSKMTCIEKLTSLQNVTAFHPEKNSVNGMMPLKNLSLCRFLSILNLENVKGRAEAAEAMLNQKKNLNELTLEWNHSPGITDNSNTNEEVLEALEPHPSLEILRVKGYQGVKVANWMIKENWLPRLQILKLSSCNNLKEVLFLPPHLVKLYIENCDKLLQLPTVGNTLRTLKLTNCPKLVLPTISNKFLCLEKVTVRRCSRNGNQLFNDLSFLSNLERLELEGFDNLQTIPSLSPTVIYLIIEDCPKLTSVKNLLCCTSLEVLQIKRCPMIMIDEPLLVEEEAKGDTTKWLPNIFLIATDEPLLVVFGLGQQQIFSSIRWLALYGLQRPFPPLLEEQFYQLTFLYDLLLECFTTLPNLEKLTSLKFMTIRGCQDVESLPNMPLSLQHLWVYDCPKLKVNYEEGGRLRHTISHIPDIDFR